MPLLIRSQMTSPDAESVKGWAAYYAATEGRPPRPTLLCALAAFEAEPPAGPRLAIDLGCGAGRDTTAILEQGWRCLAIDADPEGLRRLAATVDPAWRHRLELREMRIEEAHLPPADLVNASFVLPFLPAEGLECCWKAIEASLRPGGRFAGQLFGPRDSWVVQGRCQGHGRVEVQRLLAGWEIEQIEEEEVDGLTPRGTGKHWHIWHINARR
jgi:tellurite methyltransferase